MKSHDKDYGLFRGIPYWKNHQRKLCYDSTISVYIPSRVYPETIPIKVSSYPF
jgi:hypothetical protein